MQHTIMNPSQQLPEGCVFTIKQHTNPPAAATGAKQQQSVNQNAYLANINFIGWPPFDYQGQTQPDYQLFSYIQFVRVWPANNVFVLFHSDTTMLFDGTSVGGFAIPNTCFYSSSYQVRAFQ